MGFWRNVHHRYLVWTAEWCASKPSIRPWPVTFHPLQHHFEYIVVAPVRNVKTKTLRETTSCRVRCIVSRWETGLGIVQVLVMVMMLTSFVDLSLESTIHALYMVLESGMFCKYLISHSSR